MTERIALDAAVHSVEDLPLRRLGRPLGRDELLRSLLLRLRQGQLLVLHGAPGSGKTTVAATIANVYLKQHQCPVLWISCSNPTLAELLARAARAFDQPIGDDPLHSVTEVRSLLAEQNPLVVLDGAIEASVLANFSELCAGGCPIVVTSDQPLPEGDWRNQPIGSLAQSDAIALFKQKAGLKDNAADEAIQAIAALLQDGALPLSLAARSMIIARQTPEDFKATIVDALESHDDDAMAAALSISFGGLNDRLRDLLLFLGATLRGEASAAFLNMLSGVAVDSIDMSMTILSRLFLVERFQRADAPYYRLHPVVQVYLNDWALERHRLDALRADIIDTTRDYLNAQLHMEDALLLLLVEMDNLIATAGWARAQAGSELAADILEALSSLDDQLREAGYGYELHRLAAIRDGEPQPETEPQDAEEPIEDVTGAEASPVEDDPADEQPQPKNEDIAESADDDQLGSLDDVDLQSVNIDQLRTALHVASQNNEDGRQLQILKAIARMQVSQGSERDAIATYGEVLDMYESSEDAEGVLETLDKLAGLLVGSDSASTAMEQVNLRSALSFARQHQDAPRVLKILEAVGKVQIEQRREKEAVATYREVLALHEKNEDQPGALEALDMLAGLLVRSDSAISALEHVQHGLLLAQDLADDEAEMFLQVTGGDAHKALGEATIAVEAYEQALTLARRRDDSQNEALILYKLGMAYLDAGEERRAIEMLEDANDRFKRQGKRDLEGKVLRGLGEVNHRLQRWSEAIGFHASALYIARELGDCETEGAQLRLLGQLLLNAERVPEALTRFREALHIAYELDDVQQIVGIIVEVVSLLSRSLSHSSIAELLVNDGLQHDPDHRELMRLKGEVASAKDRAAARGIALQVVAGSARDYAAYAYRDN
ncbi:MAG: AAA family ATPase [Chloroflexi bacterium]|nr:AAA family ATPase [Chloroflexota bacterium]